jgi:hypothetical protein
MWTGSQVTVTRGHAKKPSAIGNELSMMLHSERRTEADLGNDSGELLFLSMLEAL